MTVESESGTYRRGIAPELVAKLHQPGERLSSVHVQAHFILIHDFHQRSGFSKLGTSQALIAETSRCKVKTENVTDLQIRWPYIMVRTL